jgi:hypothetical protein
MTGEVVSRARELEAAKQAEVSVWQSQTIRLRKQPAEVVAARTSDL